MMLIATPFSSLMEHSEFRRSVECLSNLFEIREPKSQLQYGPAVIWHCELSLVKEWTYSDLNVISFHLDQLRCEGTLCQAISFHLPSRYEKNEIENGKFIGRGRPMSAQTLIKNASTNLQALKSLTSFRDHKNPLVLVENNNHLGTDAYEIITDASFLNTFTQKLELHMLLDIAHAKITAKNRQIPETKYFEELPLDRTIQVHLSRHGYDGVHYFDAHEDLADEDWKFFWHLTNRMPNLKYLTIEYYKSASKLLKMLSKLRLDLTERERQRV